MLRTAAARARENAQEEGKQKYKHIVNPFGNEDWGNPGHNVTTSYCTTSGGSCDGHHEDDVVPWELVLVGPPRPRRFVSLISAPL